jgi:SAM-dependent MidA family methyltransferase
LETDFVQLIKDTIHTDGPQSFAWFMDQALYHPQRGYYSSGRALIGRRGDYFTNVSVGPFFGRVLAAQFAEIGERLGKTKNLVIVEQGAHDGQFARDLLKAAQESSPEFFEQIQYLIIEPFPVWQNRQSETLRDFQDKVSWAKCLSELDPFVGIHFSNELLDSMPAHLIISTGHGWCEKFVAVAENKFVFVDQPIVDPALMSQVEKLPERPAGYETEINLAALDWIDDVSAKITRGYVIAIDYGFACDEFYAPHRTAGTLQVRARHRHLVSPFEQIGQADISTHVEWTSLAARAEERSLRVHGFTDQHHFITGILSELLRQEMEKNVDAKTNRAVQTLLHPEMLGRAFQVVAFCKGLDPAVPLAGFKFARDAPPRLGI